MTTKWILSLSSTNNVGDWIYCLDAGTVVIDLKIIFSEFGTELD